MPLSITQLFPFLAVAISVLAFYLPEPFVACKPAIVPLLSVVMFLMGVTLTSRDFRRVGKMPKAVGLGVLLQFTLMPSLAVVLTQLFDLGDMAPGVILLGCCSGGTASNLITYLSRGDLALSITVTLCTTLLGVFLTPLLSWFLLETSIEVNYLAMFLTIVKLVLVPVLLGILVNHLWHEKVVALSQFIPLASVLAICFIIAIVVALNAERIPTAGFTLVAVVVLHNLGGLTLAYWITKLAGFPPTIQRTLAIEVGMQNSGLAVALALKFLTPAAALAGALFSVWHNVSGSILAGFWGRSNDDADQASSL